MACLHMLLDRFVGFLLTKPFSASFVIRSSENLWELLYLKMNECGDSIVDNVGYMSG